MTSTWPRWCSTPPSSCGRSTVGRSSTPHGGNASPSGAIRPVALATAAHLERALGAVEERVEHLRIHAALAGLLGRQAVVAPHRVGRRRVVHRQVLGALARGDHLEPAGARPVDHLADQRRLVAVRQRVDDPGLARALAPAAVRPARRPRRSPSRCACGARSTRARGRCRPPASRWHRSRCRRPARRSSARCRRTGAPSRSPHRPSPTRWSASLARAGLRSAIAVTAHARRVPRLRQVHRAELAGADQADAERPAARFALLQQAMQVHGRSPSLVDRTIMPQNETASVRRRA